MYYKPESWLKNAIIDKIKTDLIEGSPDVNWTILYDRVHHFRYGCGEVRVGKLRMEENFWSKKPFIIDVNLKRLASISNSELVTVFAELPC